MQRDLKTLAMKTLLDMTEQAQRLRDAFADFDDKHIENMFHTYAEEFEQAESEDPGIIKTMRLHLMVAGLMWLFEGSAVMEGGAA
jgi:hypothetical protein